MKFIFQYLPVPKPNLLMIGIFIILASVATGCQMSEEQIDALVDEKVAQKTETTEKELRTLIESIEGQIVVLNLKSSDQLNATQIQELVTEEISTESQQIYSTLRVLASPMFDDAEDPTQIVLDSPEFKKITKELQRDIDWVDKILSDLEYCLETFIWDTMEPGHDHSTNSSCP